MRSLYCEHTRDLSIIRTVGGYEAAQGRIYQLHPVLQQPHRLLRLPRPSHVCDLTQMRFSISLLDPGSDSRRYRVEGTYQSESGGGTLRLQHKRGFESQSLPELHMDSGLVYM